jgi:superoxide dismutase, Fe-Mn family
MAFTLAELPYAYDALEPYIDTMTMEIHHTKHHGAYVSKVNDALQGSDFDNSSIESLMANISKHSAAVRNNGGGHYNHSLFWTIMSPDGGASPTGALLKAIEKSFGSFDKFQDIFTQNAVSRFGSGWSWLSLNANKELFASSSPNQDNPLMDIAEEKGRPILGLDVWEHAYYLKYQNRRPDYIKAFWNVVDWKAVSQRYEALM